MSLSVNVSLHGLAAVDITHVSVHHDEGGRVGVILDYGTQLHWDSVATFETWVDVLCQRVYEQASNAIPEGVPDDPSNAAADVPVTSISGGDITGGGDGEGTPAILCTASCDYEDEWVECEREQYHCGSHRCELSGGATVAWTTYGAASEAVA